MPFSGCAQSGLRRSFGAWSSLLLPLFLFLASCNQNQIKPIAVKPEQNKPSFNPAQTVKSASLMLSRGDYEGAVEACRAGESAHPAEAVLISGCSGVFKAVRADAGGYYDKKDCATAGWLYRLLDGTPEREDKEDNQRIKICSRQLMNDGLALYRGGELEAAVRQWQKALRMDPDNTQIKKAVKTARTQLKNINSR